MNGKRGSGFAGVREASVEIVVIRADGTVEPRGLVSYYHQNILLRWCVGLWIRRRARRLEGASRARRERSELMREGRD